MPVSLAPTPIVIPPSLLAYMTPYAAGSDGATFTTTSLTLVDVDAANAVISFTAPLSGRVLVISSFACREAGGNNVYAGLRDSSGIIAGTIANVSSGASMQRPVHRALITGLSPGAIYTYKLAFCCDAGTAAIWTGPTRGKISMEIWDAAPSYSLQILTGVRPFKFSRATVQITMNNTSWTNMPTFPALTLPAQVGDVIAATFGAYAGTGASSAYIDAVTEVASAPVNSFATGTTAPTSTTGPGVGPWLFDTGVSGRANGPAFLTLANGDISAGIVTVRLRFRTSVGTNKVIEGAASTALFSIENIGQAAA